MGIKNSVWQLNQKMGRFSQTFLQRRYSDGQKAHENMLNITNYQRNANQNYNEVSPHTSQNQSVQSLSHVQLFATPWTAAHHFHVHHQSEWSSSKNLQTIKRWTGCGEKEPSYTVGGTVNWYSHCGEEQYGDALNNLKIVAI